MVQERTLYTILGVDASADEANIEAAFASLRDSAGEDASLVRVAYETLRNADSRAAYDRKLQRARLAAREEISGRVVAEIGGSGKLWLILLLLAAMLLAFYLWTRNGVKPAPANIPLQASAPAKDKAQMPVRDERPLLQAEGASSTPNESLQKEQPASGEPESLSLPKRERMGNGFDPQYLAWSVFTIRQSRSSGSGVLIAPDKILTNCHVLAGAGMNGMVVIHSLTGKVTKAEKYARLDGEDACLVYAPNAGGEPIEWGSSAGLKEGDVVHTFGHPGGSTQVIWSQGEFLSRMHRGGEEFLMTSNYCRPGSSGGPLLDHRGRLVGIVMAVQRYMARGGEAPAYGSCISVTESTARALLGRSMFPIGFAPSQFTPNL